MPAPDHINIANGIVSYIVKLLVGIWLLFSTGFLQAEKRLGKLFLSTRFSQLNLIKFRQGYSVL